MPRGPRNLRITADGLGLTQFGGVTLIEQFFQRIRLQRNNRYSVSESLEAFYPLILGLGRIETTESLRYRRLSVLGGLARVPGSEQPAALSRALRSRGAECLSEAARPLARGDDRKIGARDSIWTARC
jgi:hypothetical protein